MHFLMIVRGTRRQLSLNLTLKKDNNFNGKEREEVSLRRKYAFQMETKITWIFMVYCYLKTYIFIFFSPGKTTSATSQCLFCLKVGLRLYQHQRESIVLLVIFWKLKAIEMDGKEF